MEQEGMGTTQVTVETVAQDQTEPMDVIVAKMVGKVEMGVKPEMVVTMEMADLGLEEVVVPEVRLVDLQDTRELV